MNLDPSIYEHTIYRSFYSHTQNVELALPTLTEDIDCHVCVIGGGLTGIATALQLAKMNYHVVLLEAESSLANQASGVNGGQVLNSYECGMEYIATKYGNQLAMQLWQLSLDAVNLIKHNIKTYNLDCDWQNGCGIVAYKAHHMQDLHNEYDLMKNKYAYDGLELYDVQQTASIVGSKIYHGCLYDCNAGHLHPLNYALGLAKIVTNHPHAHIYVKSRVTAINSNHGTHTIMVNHKHRVTAQFIVLSCNYNNGRLISQLANKVTKFETYMFATEPLNAVAVELIKNRMALFDSRNIMNYYRLSANNCLLFGGGDTFGKSNLDKIKTALYLDMLKIFPQLNGVKVQNFWSGADSLTLNLVPDVGKVGSTIYYAQGYSGQGVALSNLVGLIIANAIHGNSEQLDLFASLRTIGIGGNPLLNAVLIKMGIAYFRLKDYFY